MIIIGLCGNSGSGKGTVCQAFLKYGISSIDADRVYHDLTSESSSLNKSLAEHFGSEILNSDCSLNRKALSQIVFSDNSGELLKKLNLLTHSSVINEVERQIDELSKKGYKAVIFDAPLLFESGFDKKCDYIVAVTAKREDKIERIINRDNIDYDKAAKRIDAQLSEEFICERSDFVINNFGSVENIDGQVKTIINNIFKSEV